MKLNEVFSPIFENDEAYDGRSSSEAKNIVKAYYQPILDVINSDRPIFRGMKFVGEFALADGEKMNRRSRHTMNYYTLVVDNDVRWKDYPKRSKSFICTSDIQNAKGYGTVYVVVPLENQSFGVCSSDDFWFSFNDFRPNRINEAIYEIQRHFGLNIVDTNLANLKKGMDELVDIIANADVNNKDNDIAHDISILRKAGYEEGTSLYDWYASLYDPATNGFYKTNNLNQIPPNREVWLSGKVLFVDYELMWSRLVNMVAEIG